MTQTNRMLTIIKKVKKEGLTSREQLEFLKAAGVCKNDGSINNRYKNIFSLKQREDI